MEPDEVEWWAKEVTTIIERRFQFSYALVCHKAFFSMGGIPQEIEDHPDIQRLYSRIHSPEGQFRGRDWSNLRIWDTDLDMADFDKSVMEGFWAQNCLITNASFKGANLTNALIFDSDLSYTRLCGADLRGAEFTDVDLSNANFQRADLTGARFVKTNLSDASFAGACLDGVLFRDCSGKRLGSGSKLTQRVRDNDAEEEGKGTENNGSD